MFSYEIQENKVIPVWLRGTHNHFYELAESTRDFIRLDESASVEL
ncbi:addiction module toxin RelE [Enterococcus sp. DIV0691]|nr:addiction module toxin RelE [Enterococcus sp.]